MYTWIRSRFNIYLKVCRSLPSSACDILTVSCDNLWRTIYILLSCKLIVFKLILTINMEKVYTSKYFLLYINILLLNQAVYNSASVTKQQSHGKPSLDASLFSQHLPKLKFLNQGVVHSTDIYTWKEQPCMYLEAQNVTTVRSSWRDSTKFNYLYQSTADGKMVSPPSGMRSSVPLGGLYQFTYSLKMNQICI